MSSISTTQLRNGAPLALFNLKGSFFLGQAFESIKQQLDALSIKRWCPVPRGKSLPAAEQTNDCRQQQRVTLQSLSDEIDKLETVNDKTEFRSRYGDFLCYIVKSKAKDILIVPEQFLTAELAKEWLNGLKEGGQDVERVLKGFNECDQHRLRERMKELDSCD